MRFTTSSLLVAVALALAPSHSLSAVTVPAPPVANGPIATIADGSQIQAITLKDGSVAWYGLRYAAAPIGDLRFAAPQPPPSPMTGPYVINKTTDIYSGIQSTKAYTNKTLARLLAPPWLNLTSTSINGTAAATSLKFNETVANSAPAPANSTADGPAVEPPIAAPAINLTVITYEPDSGLPPPPQPVVSVASSPAPAPSRRSVAGRILIQRQDPAAPEPAPAPAPAVVLPANVKGPQCPQTGSMNVMAEDCLYLNIQRPALPDESAFATANLPVMVHFHGGGFEAGSAARLDPTSIIGQGANASLPVIIVTINYRLGVLGFLASSNFASLSGISPTGTLINGTSKNAKQHEKHRRAVLAARNATTPRLNNGFLDMQAAVAWTRNNIRAFGGDPDKIVVWGQSAGAFGVGAQLTGHLGAQVPVAQNQTNDDGSLKPPFRAAIMMSGAPNGVPIVKPKDKDFVYESVLKQTNCSSLPSPAVELSCLRNVTWQSLRGASLAWSTRVSQSKGQKYVQGAYVWTGVRDGGPTVGGFFRTSPSTVVKQHEWADVPLLSGNNLDEGTQFSPDGLFDDDDLQNWFGKQWFFEPQSAAAQKIFKNLTSEHYPDDPAQGSPFAPVNTDINDRFNGVDNQYKRASAMYGDIRFHSARRLLLESFLSRPRNQTAAPPASANTTAPATAIVLASNDTTPIVQPFSSFTYLYANTSTADTNLQGIPHGSDLDCASGLVPNGQNCLVFARFLVAFATNLDPNVVPDGVDPIPLNPVQGPDPSVAPVAPTVPTWPAYDLEQRGMLAFVAQGPVIIPDTYRQKQIEMLNSDDVIEATGR